MKLETSCIRAEADYVQILRCKEDLNAVATSIEGISKVMALAGNKVRFKMLYLLQRENELCPCDFADILEMSVPAISQHLRKMKDEMSFLRVGMRKPYFIEFQRRIKLFWLSFWAM